MVEYRGAGGEESVASLTVFVDCSGVSCAIASPPAGSLDPALGRVRGDGRFTADVVVQSDPEAMGLPVELYVDDVVVRSSPVGADGRALFDAVELGVGTRRASARCVDAIGNVTSSGGVTWDVPPPRERVSAEGTQPRVLRRPR